MSLFHERGTVLIYGLFFSGEYIEYTNGIFSNKVIVIAYSKWVNEKMHES